MDAPSKEALPVPGTISPPGRQQRENTAGQKQNPIDNGTQQRRTPTSDDRKDADDMDSNRMDLTQRSGAHQPQVANSDVQGPREPGNQQWRQR